MRRRLQRRLRSDAGLTLAELMVTLMILSIVGVVFTSVLASSLQATRNIEGAARTNDDLRLVMVTMDREIKAASQICHPSMSYSSNQLIFETRMGAGQTRVISYYLDDPDGDGVADLVKSVNGAERIVVTDVVNGWVGNQEGLDDLLFTNQGTEEGQDTGGSPAQGRVIGIRLWIDFNPRDAISPKLETLELTGRNIWNPNAGCQ